jgi:hypothetical protein
MALFWLHYSGLQPSCHSITENAIAYDLKKEFVQNCTIVNREILIRMKVIIAELYEQKLQFI